MIVGEAEYLIGRASAQLALANRATIREVMNVHLEMSSRYLERAHALIDAERFAERRGNVISMVRRS